MRKSGFFALVISIGVLLAWQSWQKDAESAAGHDLNGAIGFGLGLRIAGSYLVEFEQLPPFPRPPVPALATLHVDGAMTATDVATMFGDGNVGVLGYRSPIHGAWRRIGNRDVAFRLLGFGYDQAGNLGAPGLGGGSMLRTSGDLAFANNLSSFSGTAQVEVFAPGQDPLDGDEVPLFSIPIAVEGRRIHVD